MATLSELVGADGVFTDGDWVESKDQDPQGPVRLLQLADVGDGVLLDKSSRFMNEEQVLRLGCTQLANGDVLIARMPEPLGRACTLPKLGYRAVTVVDVAILRPGNEHVDSRWLMHFVNAPQFRSALQVQASGTTRQRISRKALAATRLPVPPTLEQRRIAAALDAHLLRIDSALRRLDAIHAVLAQYRQRVLNDALSGQLTQEFRASESHAARSTDSANVARPSPNGGVNEGIPLPEAALPAGWTWRRIGDVADVRVGGTPSRKEPSFWSGAVPWVSSGEVANCRISRTAECISQNGVASSSAKILPRGSVLLAMIGEGRTRGQSAILDIEAATNQNVAGIIANGNYLDPEYLWIWALASYEEIRGHGQGGAQRALSGAKVRALPMPVPPLAEQRAIAARVDSLLSLLPLMEARLRAAQRMVAYARSEVLSTAYRGELVMHDRSDPPAAEFIQALERERSEQRRKEVRRAKSPQRNASPMKPAGKDALRLAIESMPTGTFTFEALREKASGEYSEIKAALFELLQETHPLIRQRFDAEAETMVLTREVANEN